MKKLFIAMFLISFSANSLEIDEKLTSRILKVSGTKKTVLLNRGLEDGLVVGDHAKLFLTTGVIARAMVVKASPTRSIWAVYRIIDGGSLFPDKVVNIKISTPMRTTEDPTKSLKPERYAQSGVDVINIPLAAGANDLSDRKDLTQDEKDDIANLGKLDTQILVGNNIGVSHGKTLEFWGLLHFNSLSSTVDQGEDGASSTSQLANIDFSLGFEKYFDHKKGFFKNISITAFVHNSTNKSVATQGTEVSNSVFEYGVGVNWHFMAPPLTYNKVIGFASLAAGIGTTTDTVTFSSGASTGSEDTLEGSSNFLSLGMGLKYYNSDGFGGRAVVDYYRRAESYAIDTSDSEFTKTVAGPRVQLGLSYRF